MELRAVSWLSQSPPCSIPGQLTIFGGRSDTGTGFSLSTSVFRCHYHSAVVPYAFIHLPPTLYNVFLPVLQFSAVSIIPPLFHTHSFIYHWLFIMFFSQYFSFPCQYHSTIAPYSFTHLPPTLYNVFLPVLLFSPVSIIPPLLHTHSFIYHPCCIMFFSQYFSFPLSVTFHQCPILIFIFTLPEGQTGVALEPSKKQCSVRNLIFV